MAFNPQELEIIRAGKQAGKTQQQITDALTRYRTGQGPVQKQDQSQQNSGFMAAIKDIPSDVGQAFKGSVEAVSKGIDTANQTQEQVASGEISPTAGTLKTIGAGLHAGASVVGEAGLGIGKLFTSPDTEKQISTSVQEGAQKIAQTDVVKGLVERYDTLTPEQKATIDGLLGTAEGLSTMFAIGPAVKAVKGGIQEVSSALARGGSYAVKEGRVAVNGVTSDVKSLFNRPSESINDVATQVEESLPTSETVNTEAVNKKLDELVSNGKTAEARKLAESTAPKLTFKQKWAGLRPDILQRISGKQDLLKEYFDITHARNNNDTLPSVYEYGGNYARKAADEMQKKLTETGGDIGAVRQKLATYKANIDDVTKIESSFVNQLKRLNLEVINGEIRQTPGTISRLGGKGDIAALQELYKGLATLKESPTLTNIIDLRSSFDAKINFAKAAREVSSSVDPLSRQIRKDVADTAAKIVGKSNANDVKKFSEFMDAYNEITSYTDRNAGGEYLLRLVLSGRGGEARQVINTIKNFTGIDLQDHATMMQIANELIGNDAQKNLFRQEVTKAGLDAASLLRGDVTGAASTLFNKTVDKLINPEQIFLDAAKAKSAATTVTKKAPTLNIDDPIKKYIEKINNGEIQMGLSLKKTVPDIQKLVDSGGIGHEELKLLRSIRNTLTGREGMQKSTAELKFDQFIENTGYDPKMFTSTQSRLNYVDELIYEVERSINNAK